MSHVYWYLDFAALLGERVKSLQCSRHGVRSLLTFQTFIMLKINSYRTPNIEHLHAKKKSIWTRTKIRKQNQETRKGKDKEDGKRSTDGCYDCHFCNEITLWIVYNLCNDTSAWYCMIVCCAVRFLFATYDMERATIKLCIWQRFRSTQEQQKRTKQRRPNTVHCSFNETIKIRRRTENGRWPFRSSLHCQSVYLLNDCEETQCKLKKTYMNWLGAFNSEVEPSIQPVSCYQFKNVTLWAQLLFVAQCCHHKVVF